MTRNTELAAAPRVQVGPFSVVDLGMSHLTNLLVDASSVGGDRPIISFCCHVAALNHATDREYLNSVDVADVIHADGMSTVFLARLAGARAISRSPVTDMGHVLIDRMAAKQQRPVALALIGGVPGLAIEAGITLEHRHSARVVFTSHGFHTNWVGILKDLRASQPDVVFIGMGTPTEATFVAEHLEHLPPSLIVTCGGWYGFLSGREGRAPRRLQSLGLEWAWRLGHDPRRLQSRYRRGFRSTARIAAEILSRRVRTKRS